jgi:hypothetical protein
VIVGPPAIGGLPRLVADDSSGVFVAWQDYRNNVYQYDADIFCQRFRPDATPAPGWTSSGTPICTAPNVQTDVQATSDHAGGAWIAWDDQRSEPPNTLHNDDVYLARVRADGSLAPGIPVNGLPIVVAQNTQQLEDLESDPYGNALACWSDTRPGAAGVYLQRVQLDGTLGSGWPVNGLRVSTINDATFKSVVTPDQMGGAFVAFTAYFTGKVYVQHLLANGQVAPGWPPQGLPVTTIPGGANDEDDAAICPDGAGGCIVVWSDWRLGFRAAFAQHFDGLTATAAELALVRAEATPERVRLEWSATGGSVRAAVERRTAIEAWSQVGEVSSDGAGLLRFEDRAVVAGARYAYRLVPAGAEPTSETWVEVPAAVFALRGLVPHPANGTDVHVAFSLPTSGPARIELLDIAGRLIERHDETALEAGEHRLRPFGRAIPPGVYWLRLSQGAHTATARAVVIR